jgi:hypothetical protein
MTALSLTFCAFGKHLVNKRAVGFELELSESKELGREGGFWGVDTAAGGGFRNSVFHSFCCINSPRRV